MSGSHIQMWMGVWIRACQQLQAQLLRFICVNAAAVRQANKRKRPEDEEDVDDEEEEEDDEEDEYDDEDE